MPAPARHRQQGILKMEKMTLKKFHEMAETVKPVVLCHASGDVYTGEKVARKKEGKENVGIEKIFLQRIRGRRRGV